MTQETASKTRVGLLLPHFGEDADHDLLIEGARRARIRLDLGAVTSSSTRTGWKEATERPLNLLSRLPSLAGATERIGPRVRFDDPVPSPDLMAFTVAALSWMSRRRFDQGAGAGNFQHRFDVIGMGEVKLPT